MKKFNEGILLKVVSIITAVVLMTGTLSGCGSKATDKDEQGRTVITVGGWPDKEGTALETRMARKADFEKNNPDVVIEPDYWKFDLKTFYAKAAGGQLPITYDTHFTEIGAIIDSGYAADLTPALKKHGYDGMFNEKIVDIVSKDGKIYAFPFSTYVMGLAFNTDLFKQAGLLEEDGTPKQPKDWNELIEFAVQIKEKTGKPGFIFPSAENFGGWIFSNVAWSFGVDFMEQDEEGKWQATFNTPEAAEALQFIKDLKWKYDVLPANTLVNFTEYYKVFATGGAGMLITDGSVPAKLVQYEMNPDHIGMMGLPAGPKRHVTLLGGSVFEVAENATDDQIDAAIRWFESSYSHEASDEYKTNKEREIDEKLSKNELVGIKSMSIWSEKSQALNFEYDLIDSKANSNPNHVKLYNDFVANCPAEIQPEEPVCCQELYATIDNCIQEVLTNKDADCAVILEKANADFQANYLDNLTY